MGRDLTQLFASALAKHDRIAGNTQIIEQGLPPITLGLDSPQLKQRVQYQQIPQVQDVGRPVIDLGSGIDLYPEETALKQFKTLQQQEKEFSDVVNSLTNDEMTNLLLLNKEHVVIQKSVLRDMGLKGESLEIKRLEQLGAVKRESVDDLLEFRLTGIGRKILKMRGY